MPAKRPSQSLTQFDVQMTAKSILSGLRVDHQKVRRCFVRGFGGSQRRTFFHASGRRRGPFTYDTYYGIFGPPHSPSCTFTQPISTFGPQNLEISQPPPPSVWMSCVNGPLPRQLSPWVTLQSINAAAVRTRSVHDPNVSLDPKGIWTTGWL